MYEVVFFFQITAYVKIKLSPQQCKSGITSLVGGEVVGEVGDSWSEEVRAWLLRN